MEAPKALIICHLSLEAEFGGGNSPDLIPAYTCKEKCFHFDSGVCCYDGEDCKPITYVLKED